MQIIRIGVQIFILWIFAFIGNWIVELTGIIIPGSIIGLLLLWICLYQKWLDIRFVQDGASFLITFLTLFFIPSTVGIIQYPELLTTEGFLLLAAVFISSIFAFVFTGKLSQSLERIEERKGGEKDDAI